MSDRISLTVISSRQYKAFIKTKISNSIDDYNGLLPSNFMHHPKVMYHKMSSMLLQRGKSHLPWCWFHDTLSWKV